MPGGNSGSKHSTSWMLADDDALPLTSPAANFNDRVEITLVNGRKSAVGATVDPMALARLLRGLDRA